MSLAGIATKSTPVTRVSVVFIGALSTEKPHCEYLRKCASPGYKGCMSNRTELLVCGASVVAGLALTALGHPRVRPSLESARRGSGAGGSHRLRLGLRPTR